MENFFLESIIHEENVCGNDYFTVVKDIDPIADRHVMMFPNSHYLSLADAGVDSVVDFVDNRLSKLFDNEQYMLAEKGCANLWTSIEGVVHAHAHIVPKVEDVRGLFDLPNVQTHEDISAALHSLKPDAQYLLWGQLGREFYTVQPLNDVPKRIIRNNLKKQYEMSAIF